jgi:glucose-6-phosphate isomerase
MPIIVEKSKLNSDMPKPGDSGAALDELWRMSWIKSSMLPDKNETVDEADNLAGEMRSKSDKIVIVAGGAVGHLTEAALAALKPAGGREIIVAGESLSASDFTSLAEKLKAGNFSMIAVANEDETPSQSASYTFVRRLLTERYGSRGANSRTTVIASGKSRFIAENAVNGGIKPLMLAEDAQAVYSGNTMALLLPLMAAGIDGRAYMDGFREMIVDTWWDADGDEFSIDLAAAVKSGRTMEDVVIWQSELAAFGSWVESLHRSCGIDARRVMMPGQKSGLRKDACRTLFIVEKENSDVMLPAFPGCGPEGSLNIMLQTAAEEHFAETAGTKIMLEEMTPFDFGRLAAFVQISAGITSFILNN